jgi:hypothetical protein
VTLSGRILEVLPDGTRRPVRARQVHVDVDVADATDPQRVGWVPVGTDGSYRVTGVLDGRFVKITGVDTTGLRPSYRLCGTHTTTSGDTVLDVPLFLPGAPVPTPTLSGLVFTVVDGNQVPLAGVDVYYQSRGWGPDVSGYTDHNGQYSLCGIPLMPGTLYMVCGNGETVYSRPVDVRANHVIDIDATKFHTCLGFVQPR